MELVRSNAVVTLRDYRKGNWTLEETLVLIEAKRLESQRRMLKNTTTTTTSSSSSIIKPSGELRWKWIEEHCWRNGCFRSQNQCNDKWDNMMRDFKKVREFERRRRSCDNDDGDGDNDNDKVVSYWKMDKIQRKNNNLPSNMLPQVYQALADVVEAKLGGAVVPTVVSHQETTAPPPPPLPPPLLPPEEDAPATLPTQESPTKRRRASEEGISIAEQISSSANVLIEAIKKYDEREETRHRELYELHQRRYNIEESRIESERQGFNALVDAINNLSNSIFAFTSQRTHH